MSLHETKKTLKIHRKYTQQTKGTFWLKSIKQVIDLMKRSELTEFEFEEDGFKLRLSRQSISALCTNCSSRSSARPCCCRSSGSSSVQCCTCGSKK